MFKYLVALLVLIAALVGGFFWLNGHIYDEKQGGVENYLDATFVIQDQVITLTDGEHVETSAPNEEVQWKTTTKYFGNLAKGDLNGDGITDLAFILTQNGGGTGTFFYVVVALQNNANRYIGTNGILIGDRIAPQTTEIRDGRLVVNYADRNSDEPFSVQPHSGVTQNFHVENGVLIAD
ncbi:MAG: hypothetical protein WA021_02300 [Minisyncoccia bacterium]